MKIGDLITYTNGSINYILRVAEKINDKTFVALHANEDGTCQIVKDGEFPYGANYPLIEILRQKKDGTWRAGNDIVTLVS